MFDLKNINNNIIANQWKARYEKLSEDKKKKLSELDNANISEYQLQVIKRKRIYPEIGDVFIAKIKNGLTVQGIVVNNHISNINGEDLILVMIFNIDVFVEEVINKGVKDDDLLISPVIVGKEYWTKGYFSNIKNISSVKDITNYGFYSVGKGKYFNEYGNELIEMPKLLGTYGVATISGIAYEITQELIIAGIL